MKRFLVFLDRIHFRWLGIAAVLALLIFSGCYYWAGLYGQGVVPTYTDSPATANVSECMYFSAVTFSSLGYGDFRPVGISRLVASVEVFVGLAFLGIAIAKLSSARQSYYTARLFSSDAQARFDKFSMGFNEMRLSLEATSDSQKIQEIIVTTNFRFVGLSNYIKYEVANGPFFDEVPIRAVRRSVRYLSMLLTELEQNHFNEMQSATGRKLFRNVTRLMPVIEGASRNEFLVQDCEKLRSMTSKKLDNQKNRKH